MINKFELEEAPILLIGFNRPEIIAQTFEYIRKAHPSRLYVAIDGHRSNKADEAKLVEEVKKIVENVDWTCETHYKYNEFNKGAEITVSSAISWVFETEEYAIILEDDIIAPLSFLKFAEEMLIKYKNEEKIGTITASNLTPIPLPANTDYFFAKYGHSGGGWATWKRFWDKFDLNIEIQEKHLSKKFIKTICNSRKEVDYYYTLFKKMKKKGIGNSTWDYVGLYIARVNKILSIIPRSNLSSNIGTYGLHASGKTAVHFLKYDANFEIRNHPEKVHCFIEYDINHFEKYIYKKKKNIFIRSLKKVKRIICEKHAN